jgi:hypothetical protein
MAFFVAYLGEECALKHDRLLPRPQNRSQRCRRCLRNYRNIHGRDLALDTCNALAAIPQQLHDQA